MRKIILGMIIIMCFNILIGCSEDKNKVAEKVSEVQPKQIDSASNMPITDTVDYSAEFNGIKGCAVIFNAKENHYLIYNDSMINEEVSPYSTFKIVSTLIGLSSGVLTDENSHMQYNGTVYSFDSWNANLTLKEAFQYSCVWYFRQVIDAVGKDKVEKELKALDYGNCDVSEWEGSNENAKKDVNGFWLDSSLKISPMEQVQVLEKIFEGKTTFTQDNIDILKEIMLFDEVSSYKLYGKTGTGRNGEAWYAGVAEKEGKREYFAVYLDDEQNKDVISGKYAREIIKKIYSEK